MKKTVIIAALFLFENVGFSAEPQDIHTTSKCQSFVSGVFTWYGLPLPGTVEFSRKPTINGPGYRSFNLENYNQEKPEFEVVTRPMRILQKTDILGRVVFQPQRHLKLLGRTLEDGNYEFLISEIKLHPQDEPIILNQEGSLEHRFQFSDACEFQGYHIRQNSSIPKSGRGYSLSADSNCKFDEPGEKRENNDVLAAHVDDPYEHGYMILIYPGYFRGLCRLARETSI